VAREPAAQARADACHREEHRATRLAVLAVRNRDRSLQAGGRAVGSAATLAVACRMDGEKIAELPDTLMVTLDHHMRYDGTAFEEKLGRAAARYFFLDG
jgi:hypothetical protein